jgi:hypothetical protein
VERLRRFAEEHLLFEAGMLYEVTAKLMNRHHADDLVVENALLGSVGVHSRNLIDFLGSPSRCKPLTASPPTT